MISAQTPTPAPAPLRPPSIVYTPVDERGAALDLRGNDLALWQAVHQYVLTDTRSPIKAVSAAIGAVNRRNRDLALRSTVFKPSDRLSGWGIHFGSSAARNSQQTWFSHRTNFHLIRGIHIPLRWCHEDDEVIGFIDSWQRHTSWGYWFNCVVTAAHREPFIELASTGRLHFSSACPAATVTDDGEILNWPIDELSACPVGAEAGLGSIIVDYQRAA